MLVSQTFKGFAILAMLEYSGFTGVLSRTSVLEIPDSPADQGITGYAGVMAGVLWQARNEALAGDNSAREWLESDDCADFCVAVGFDHNLVLQWIRKPKHRLKG